MAPLKTERCDWSGDGGDRGRGVRGYWNCGPEAGLWDGRGAGRGPRRVGEAIEIRRLSEQAIWSNREVVDRLNGAQSARREQRERLNK